MEEGQQRVIMRELMMGEDRAEGYRSERNVSNLARLGMRVG